ncbi:MAG: 30S ribosomal protein S17 [Proteobacteria bacterium]|nr:30S ribosomal protein S17 [Pseudomonadota bacterium]
MAEKTRGHRKRLIGVIVSDKMQKTVTVLVEGLRKHPTYEKYVSRSEKYKAHDEENTCRVGDKVLIEETRPLSRDKRWKVKEILERAV